MHTRLQALSATCLFCWKLTRVTDNKHSSANAMRKAGVTQETLEMATKARDVAICTTTASENPLLQVQRVIGADLKHENILLFVFCII